MKKIKTSEVINIYSIIKSAKVSKVAEDAEKYNIIKAIRPLKKIAEEFESWQKDAIETLKADNHDEMVAKAQKWQAEEKEGKEISLTEAERIELNKYFYKFNNDVNKCMSDELNKENELDITTIREKSFEQLISSNDWSVEQIMQIESYIL